MGKYLDTSTRVDRATRRAALVRFVKPDASRQALLVGFLFPLALDVRAMNGVDVIALQILLVATSVVCGGAYFLLEFLSSDRRFLRSSLSTAAIAWWIYLATSPIPILVWDVDVGHYLRVALPFVLFGVGLSVVLAAERRNVDPAVLLDVLVWCALVSTVWRVMYAVAIGGVSLDTVRWQILGPAIPLALGYGAAGLYLGRNRAVSAVAVIVACACVLLSVTRSYAISAFFVGLGILVVDSRRRSSVRAATSMAKLLLVLLPLSAATVAITALARPDFAAAWTRRLFQHSDSGGVDITLVMRVAEVQGQVTALIQKPLSLLIGNGIGADYIWDRGVLRALAFEVEAEQATGWFAGHFTWVYSFFASGLVLGSIVPLVLVVAAIRGFSAASKYGQSQRSNDAVLAFAIFLAYLGQSLTTHVMYDRYGALILGVVTGAILVYERQLSAFRVVEIAPPRLTFAPPDANGQQRPS